MIEEEDRKDTPKDVFHAQGLEIVFGKKPKKSLQKKQKIISTIAQIDGAQAQICQNLAQSSTNNA